MDTGDPFRHVEQVGRHERWERERTVFAMKEYRDLSTKEIASHLGISPEAVRKALSRARIAVRNHFEKQYSSEL